MSGKTEKKRRTKKQEQMAERLASLQETGINAPRLTKEAWIKLFGNDEDSLLEYEEENYDDNLAYFLEEYLWELGEDVELFDDEGTTNPAVANIICRAIALDDAFIEWMNEHGYRNIDKAIDAYCADKTQEDADRMMRQHGWNHHYAVYGLPVTLIYHGNNDQFPPKLDLQFPKDQASLLQMYLDLKFDGSFAVLPYLLDPQDFIDEFDKIKDFGKTYFDTGTKIQYGMWNEHRFDTDVSYNAVRMYIPIVHKFDLPANALTLHLAWDVDDIAEVMHPDLRIYDNGYPLGERLLQRSLVDCVPDCVLLAEENIVPIYEIADHENEFREQVIASQKGQEHDE